MSCRLIGYSQDFWEPIATTPDSSNIRTVKIASNGDIYIGMWGVSLPGGIYRSGDEGLNWEYLGLDGEAIYSIVLLPNGEIIAGVKNGIYKWYPDTDIWELVYDATGNFRILFALNGSTVFSDGGYNLHGILKSSDYGESWDTCFLFPDPWNVELEQIVLSEDSVLYAGSSSVFGPGAIYKSDDLGENWQEFESQIDQPISLTFDPDGKLLVGSIGQGLYRYSFDNESWENLVPQLTIRTILCIGNYKIYLGISSSPAFFQGVYYSSDGGENFEWLNSGLGSNGYDIYFLDHHPYGKIYAKSHYTLWKSSEQIPVNIDAEKDAIRFCQNYPNPFITHTTLLWDTEKTSIDAQLKVYSLNGDLIIDKRIENTGQHTINCPEAASGLYYFTIITEDLLYYSNYFIISR